MQTVPNVHVGVDDVLRWLLRHVHQLLASLQARAVCCELPNPSIPNLTTSPGFK
jgi:hypothetical protein